MWIDAVLGYLTLSKKWSIENKVTCEEFWREDAVSYYVHGKDNIPFHSIILPALINGIGYKKLPDRIISSEYLTLEGKKISTSNNWAVWIPDIIERYNTDALRYFFLINGPERRDTDFSWREFINSNNGELLGAYGNLVNRTLVFAKKYLNNEIPKGEVESKVRKELQELYVEVGANIENGNLKLALEKIFEFIRSINKYFDENTPWITINSNIDGCKNTIYNCIYVIGNLSNLLTPFLPESSEKIKTWLGIYENQWDLIELEKGREIGEVSILFQRLDKSLIEEEKKRLLAH